MRVVAIVPMKLNNERLSNKNIKAFDNGKPLCYYILKTLLNIELIDEVYVYCSDESIKEYIPEGVIYLNRNKKLDSSSTKMNEVLISFSNDIQADVYVMTHTTAPFITKENIMKGLLSVLGEGYDSSFAAKKIQDFIWQDGKPLNYNLDDIPRTQDINPLFVETSGFYIYKSEVIKEYGRRIGENPCIIEVDEIESIDIDEKEDFDIANAIYNQIFLKK